MQITWEVISTELVKHSAVYISAAEGLFIAAVCTWPKYIPKTPQELWDWARDTFQTVVPAARPHNVNPIPPVEPAQPKK